MGRQLNLGPACEWFSPFLGLLNFSLESGQKHRAKLNFLTSSVLFRIWPQKKVPSHKRVYLKEDDLTKTLGFHQNRALWDGNFFGGRFVCGFRHSGERLNFSLESGQKYRETELFKKFCLS